MWFIAAIIQQQKMTKLNTRHMLDNKFQLCFKYPVESWILTNHISHSIELDRCILSWQIALCHCSLSRGIADGTPQHSKTSLLVKFQ